ncbi:MAG: hemerythrin domain-containing protein [Acidobacteria bacterium]|nr:hemerythrin domain-containing protein [Acidobacteriota bacterium]
MHEATTILRQEHDAILRMLDATEEVARRLRNHERVEPQVLDNLLEFFRQFADRCHHGKEEDLLFPLLEKKGMSRGGGPIGVMLMEHDQGRGLVGQMATAGKEYATGDSPAGLRWAAAATDYAGLLREHIAKENEVLFVMAERMLTPAEQQELALAFDKNEIEKMGAGTHERLHAMMDKLLAGLQPAGR